MGALNFIELGRIEEQALLAKLRAVRSSIEHASEKGRSLEFEVIRVLREFLPVEYGLSSGFVAWLSPDGPKLSPQLDVIIYDAIRFGPLIQLGPSAVFPLEAVYGYIEVKASLRSSDAEELPTDSIEHCIVQNRTIREMNRRFYISPSCSSPATLELSEHAWLSLRSYIFAFEAGGSIANNLAELARRTSEYLKRVDTPAHIHGIYIVDKGFLYTKAVVPETASKEDYFHVRYTKEHGFLAFKTSLMQSLASFDRPDLSWTFPIEKYYEHLTDWHEAAPAT